MKAKGVLFKLVAAIAAITVVSGAVQAVAPGFILGLISGDAAPANLHSFAIIGMFMVLFGGLLLHALLSQTHHPVAVFWAALQKFGAAGAVGLGVAKGLFGGLALAVAAFDLLSGFLVLAYWRSLKGTR